MEDPGKRKEATGNSVAAFTYAYLGHYIQFETPDFHKEIFELLHTNTAGIIVVIAFRGSAKSTIMSLAYALWSAVTGRRLFIVILSDTFTQAKLIISNLKSELDNNTLLRRDYGPFDKEKNEWTATNIVLDNGVRIMARSRGQRLRGARHKEHRPDLIIGDDIENNDSVRTKEQRDKTEEWLLSEVIPSLDTERGQLIIVGNLLHRDAVMARLKEKIEKKGIGIIREYPLQNEEGDILWPSRYNEDSIAKLRATVGDRFFLREYLLKLVPEEGQVIKKINYYEELPEIYSIGIGVDLAISKRETADYTAIDVVGKGKDGKFYNLDIRYGRWDFNEGLQEIKNTYTAFQDLFEGIPVALGVEDVAYQKSAIEELIRRFSLPVKPIKRVTDKRARLQVLAPHVENGQVLFRENGDEDLIIQLTGFGIEAHDDLADAFEIAVNLLLKQPKPDIDFF